ncbi:MAG: hypothetical protein NT075_00620 [Chloroflexi bacterium]|nr:hypothetical protein [Chloroflexota bacterium]
MDSVLTIQSDETGIGVSTLQGLRALQRLYEQGYQDDVVDLTVHKLLEHQVQKDQTQLIELANQLAVYEERFGLASEQFYEKYKAGQQGDDEDSFEWQVLYQMYTRLRHELETLQGSFQDLV